MALPKIKFAIYYGTIRLHDGTMHTYSAADLALLYNVSALPYVSYPLVGVDPIQNIGGQENIKYIRLKPQHDPSLYFDAQDKYNYNDVEYYDDDFDAKENGKWAVRPRNQDPDAT